MQRSVRTLAAAALAAAALAAAVTPIAHAQWDPFNGDWTKEVDTDIRVLTWNVQDAICSSSNRKQTGVFSDWDAVVRTLAAMKADVVVLQETGDNSGNGTGSGVDSVSALETTLDLMVNGGADPFVGGTVTSYIKFYDPNLDYPHIYVSTISDNFNRNAILSRFPFTDLNADGNAVIPNVSGMLAGPGGWPAGGNGGIRGFAFAEIDLPDDTYTGDLVVGNAHLKSGGSSSDLNDRLTAAKNVSYYIDAIFNGRGTGSPDPESRIFDNPQVQNILDENTPVIYAGDWNEDESSNGRKGPAEWLVNGPDTGGTEGVDRDRSDASLSGAVDLFTGDDDTRGGSTLDYIAYQDSIATLRRAWIFNSQTTGVAGRPAELDGFPINPSAVSTTASDHLAVVADFEVPLGAPVPDCPFDLFPGGGVDSSDLSVMLGAWGAPYDVEDLAGLLGAWGPCPQ